LLSHRSLFLLLAAVVVATALLAPGVRAATTAGPNPSPVPRFTHIVEVFLENEEAGKTWEAGGAANLQAIRASGLYVPNFYGVGHASLSNYEAAFAGVAPSATGKSDCLGQPYGTCIFPAWVPTIADRFDGAGLPWRAYAEGMAGAANGVACLHAPDRNAPDPYQGPLTNGYASRHNPAVWFERVISKDGSNAYCRAHDVDLEELWKDADAGRLPAFSFVTPDTCHDGHDTSSTGGCALDPEGPGAPSGTAAMDAWLPGFVHRLTSSPSWDDHSLLIITFDESEAADSTGCVPCKDGSTGGRIGAVLLSHLVVAGSTTEWQGDHFSILRTLETAWGLEPIGHDGDPGVTPLTGVWVNQ
jgi:hypothetical protein